MSFAALETYLLPFKNIFAEEGVNELMINKPGEVWVEKAGDLRMELLPEVDIDHLLGLGRLIAQSTDQVISAEKPLLSATLPNGYRVQVVFPPAVEPNIAAFAIRKGSTMHLSLDQYAERGAFDNTSTKPKLVSLKTISLYLCGLQRMKTFLGHYNLGFLVLSNGVL